MCNVKYPDLASQLVVNHHQEKIGSEYIYIYMEYVISSTLTNSATQNYQNT